MRTSHQIRSVLSGLLVQMTLSGIVVAAPIDEAEAAANRGDYATAAKLLLPIANGGDSRAQYWLGFQYEYGKGVPQNFAEAVRWYRKAADAGRASAQASLGFMYYEGLGVPQSYADAVTWYRKAAEQGNARAQSNLGVMYAAGKGVRQDLVEAHKWYNLAASLFSEGDRGLAVKNRDALAATMTPAEIAEAQKLAREWKPTK